MPTLPAPFPGLCSSFDCGSADYSRTLEIFPLLIWTVPAAGKWLPYGFATGAVDVPARIMRVSDLEAAMNGRRILKTAGRGLVVGGAMAAAGYAGLVGLNRAKYGDAKRSADAAHTSVLDRFIPDPEVAEHHEIAINAPADVVMTAAKSLALMTSPMIRAIFRARELALGGATDRRPHPAVCTNR